MSIETRENVVAAMSFQKDSQRTDLLNPDLTRTELIALLDYLTGERHWDLEITSVRSDHHDDGPRGHAGGFAVDCWPMIAGVYIDGNALGPFLEDVAGAPYLYQIGLAGSANTAVNLAAAGPTAFSDTGADHIHIGAHSMDK